ncbi:MAG: hypothetical protein Hyperionvirus1_96 [Hyperionvirus sp.]|uniref:Uncharacterized protein n=1 Tax=Hyperionvirus sp. TaxID=2487770 RepID=A0A3G5A5L0_9VIRU|nr:MAG: hypothetical protein Hyperionvirus1_96 [Hyperionvirus sp.]
MAELSEVMPTLEKVEEKLILRELKLIPVENVDETIVDHPDVIRRASELFIRENMGVIFGKMAVLMKNIDTYHISGEFCKKNIIVKELEKEYIFSVNTLLFGMHMSSDPTDFSIEMFTRNKITLPFRVMQKICVVNGFYLTIEKFDKFIPPFTVSKVRSTSMNKSWHSLNFVPETILDFDMMGYEIKIPLLPTKEEIKIAFDKKKNDYITIFNSFVEKVQKFMFNVTGEIVRNKHSIVPLPFMGKKIRINGLGGGYSFRNIILGRPKLMNNVIGFTFEHFEHLGIEPPIQYVRRELEKNNYLLLIESNSNAKMRLAVCHKDNCFVRKDSSFRYSYNNFKKNKLLVKEEEGASPMKKRKNN